MSEKRVANIEACPKYVSMQGGDRLYDWQYRRLQALRAYQKVGFTHVSIGGGKPNRITSAIQVAQRKSGGVCGLEMRERRHDEYLAEKAFEEKS